MAIDGGLLVCVPSGLSTDPPPPATLESSLGGFVVMDSTVDVMFHTNAAMPPKIAMRTTATSPTINPTGTPPFFCIGVKCVPTGGMYWSP